MPIYKLNGDTYNIPDDVVSSFESDHPEATVRYKTKEGYYNIPVKHRDGFLKKYPDAEVYNGKNSQKEDITQGKTSTETNPFDQPLHVEVPESIRSANGLSGSNTTSAYTLPETIIKRPKTTENEPEDDRLFEENMQRMKEGKPLNRVTTQSVIDANPDLGLQGSSYQPTEEEIRSYTLRNKPGMFKNRTSSLIDKPLGDAAESVEGYGDKANARVDLLKKYYSGDEFKQRIKKETGARVTDLLEQTDADLNTINEKISAHQKAMRNENWRPGMPSSRDDNTLVELRRQRTLLNNAENILDDSRKIVDEAGKKDSSWYESLGRGVRDKVFDVDSWTMGITDMAGSMNLNKVLEKADREEELDPAEQRLLDAAVTNMAVNAYYSSDLSAAYKAGQVTGESIPFMLEMAINPVSASGNATAKLLLKYGLKKFGQQIGKNVGKTIGAAAGMTATTGVPGVIGGAYDRMNGQVQFGLDDKGKLTYKGRENAMDAGEALAKSAASRFLENHSEMVFNAFKGLGDVVWRGVEKVVPGGVNSFIQKAADSGAGRMFRELGNNELMKEAAKRTQFHGIVGEYLEEVYNNLANVPLGEMTMEQVTDLDRNIDTFLGLAPTSVFFGLLGLGSISAERIQHRRKMDAAFGNMNEVQRKKLAELERMSKENGNADIRTFIKETMADPGLTKEQKRQEIEYAYDIAVNNAFDEVADEQAKEQGEFRAEAHEEGQAVYESGDPAAIRESVVREEVSRGRLEEVYPDVETIARLMQADDAGRAEILDEMPEEVRDRAMTFLRDYDRHQSVEDAINEAHVPEVEAAQARVEEMTRHGRVTMIPLGRFADETHKFGIVVNGLDEAGNTTGNGNFVMVVPIKEGANGPDFSTFDMGKAEVVSLDPSVQRQEMDPVSIIESMLESYQADVDKLSQTPVAAGQTYSVLDSSGRSKNIQIQGQDAQGNWVVAVEGQKNPSVMPEENLLEMLAEAERAPVVAAYAAEEQAKTDAKSAAQKEIMSDKFSPEVMSLQPEPGEEIEVNGRRASVMGVTPDGINVRYLTEGGMTAGSGIISMEDYYTHKQALFDSSQTNQEPVQEEQVIAEEKQTEPAIPVKDDGSVDYVSYGSDNTLKLLGEKYGEKMPHKVAVTAEAYKADLAKMQKKLDKAAEDYDNAPIGREAKASSALKKVSQEYEALKRESDFWSALEAEIKAAQEKPGETVAEEILSMEEPLTGEEFAAQMLANGNIKLLRESFVNETGFGNDEAKSYLGLFASVDKGGLTIQEAGEKLMEADRENGTGFYDQNDPNAGRNAILEVLGLAKTRGDLAGFIKKNRSEQAKKEQDAEYAAYESWVEENFHMSAEEFEAYEEVIARDLAERALSESEYNEFMSIFVDETVNNVIYGQQGIDSESETGSEVLPGTQPLQTERAGRTEKESSEIDVNIVGQNGTVSEGTSGSELASRIEAARSEVNANPSEAQKEAGNYKMGHVRIDGYDITIENPKGSVRSGVDKGGKSWSITMNNDYGYIRGTEAVDGDHIDVFLSDTPDSGRVFVVDQKNEDGSFDESKVMYGFDSLEEARNAYLSNYNAGWESRIMAITEVSKEDFKKWIDSSRRKTKAFSEYKSVKQESAKQLNNPLAKRQDETGYEYALRMAEEKRRIPLRSRANEWAKVLGVKVNFIEKREDVKNKVVFAAIERGQKVTGWFDLGNGEVYFYMPNLDNMSEVDNTYVHEVVSHKGLPQLLGKKRFDELCDKVWNMMPQSAKDVFINYPGVNGNTRIAADEYIAHLAEQESLSPDEKSVWDEIVKLVRDMLDKVLNSIVGKSEITDKDISKLIKASYANLKFGAAENVEGESTRLRTSRKIEKLFDDAVAGNLTGKPVSIGKLTSEGKDYLERISGLKLKSDIDFVLNPSDLVHIYRDHYETNEKDTGKNVPLTKNDIRRLVDVISFPNKVVFGIEEGSNRKLFYFLMDSAGGTYNLLEVYADRKGNLTTKTYYKTKKDAAQRVMELENSLLPTSETYSGAILSDTKIPKIFEPTNDSSEKSRFRVVYHGSGAEFDKFSHEKMGTGAGSQVFGWGTYVTESTDIAKDYANISAANKLFDDENNFELVKSMPPKEVAAMMIKREMDSNGKPLELAKEYVANNFEGTAEDEEFDNETREFAHKLSIECKDVTEEDLNNVALGRHLYEVEIPDEKRGNYIVWGNNVTDASAKKVLDGIYDQLIATEEYDTPTAQKELRKELDNLKDAYGQGKSGIWKDLYGDVSSCLGSDKDASLFLHSLGYVGIKYPAGTIYKENYGGAHNYVIFDENDLRIVEHTIFRVYKSKDGKETKYKQLSLFDEGIKAVNDGGGSYNIQREETSTIESLNRLRELQEGEICNVERRFTESKEFSFTRGEKIESAADVAYIFKSLEDEAIENSFVAVTNGDNVTVLHLGMGAQTQTVADTTAIFAAVERLGADKIFFVHNHPTGNVKCSRQDVQTYQALKDTFGDKLQDGIIINTRSGKYGLFNSSGLVDDEGRIKEEKDEYPISVYKFNKQAFNVDEIPSISPSSDGIAEFVSTQRLGKRDKINALLLNNNFGCVGNILIDNSKNTKAIVEKITNDAIAMGARQVVIYGRYPFVEVTDRNTNFVSYLSSGINKYSQGNVKLLDIIQIDEPYSKSANDEGVRFRFTSEEQSIVEKAKADGTYMKASNGNPTNLNEKQWAQVRTKSFKKWFGDWENDAANASKVVDENGEPLVVLHRTPNEFTEFDKKKIGSSTDYGAFGSGFYFSPSDFGALYGSNMIEVFLNIKNPLQLNRSNAFDVKEPFFGDNYKWGKEQSEKFAEWAKENGYDGVHYENGRTHDEFITFEPNQIKSATENVGTFDEGKSDIRFRIANKNQEIFVSNAAKAVEGIKQEKATPQQWLAMVEKNGGLKAGEDKWLGLSDWLKGLDKKSVTKEEILDFINQNKIRIEEVQYTEDGEDIVTYEDLPARNTRVEDWDHYGKETGHFGDFWASDKLGGVNGKIFISRKELRAEKRNVYVPLIRDRYLQNLDSAYPIYYDTFEGAVDGLNKYFDNHREKKAHRVQTEEINSTRLEYTTQGLENNAEIALIVPTIESWNEDDEIHFGDAGEGRAIAWIRFGETRGVVNETESVDKYLSEMRSKYNTAEGEEVDYMSEDEIKHLQSLTSSEIEAKDNAPRILVIDEIQSKRHQEGREKGYKSQVDRTPAKMEDLIFGEFNGLTTATYKGERLYFSKSKSKEEILDMINERISEGQLGSANNLIPDAPFEKNWSELAFKRMLRYAAENGFDKVAWTKGAQQAERYNIGGLVDSIYITKSKKDSSKYSVTAFDRYAMPISSIANEPMSKEELETTFGKELAQKLIEGEARKSKEEKYAQFHLDGVGLQVGGEGMKGFYDKMLPSFVNKYVKKWGAKVQDIELPNVEEAGRIMHSVDVTDAMKESVMEGQTMFRISDKGRKIQAEVDKFTSKYNSKPVNVVESTMTDEELMDAFENAFELEDVKSFMKESKTAAGYFHNLDKIVIFADRAKEERMEEYLFHENIHAAIHHNKFSNLVAYFYEYAKDAAEFERWNKLAHNKEYKKYNSSEEFLAYVVSNAMVARNLDDVANYLGDKQKDALNVLFDKLGYDYDIRRRSNEQPANRRTGKETSGQSALEGNELQDTGARGRIEEGTGKDKSRSASQRKQAERLKDFFDKVAEMGLRGVLGNTEYDFLMRDIYNALPKDVRLKIKNDAQEYYDGDFVPAMSDYLNIKGKASVWDKIVGVLKEALRRSGFDLPLSESDVKYLIWRNRKPLNPYSIIEKAEDVHKRFTLKVGSYSDKTSEVRFREQRPAIVQEYDKVIDSSIFRFKEAFQDSMRSLKVLMDIIEKETGRKAKSFENAYTAENRLSSINKVDNEKYLELFFNPLMAEIKVLSDKVGQQVVEDYIYAKSGLERNEVLKQRDADKAYAESMEELDEKLRKGELSDDQYDALKTNAEIARGEAMAKEDDYAGLRGLLFNSKARELEEKLSRSEISKDEYSALFTQLEENAEDVEKDFKEFAEKIVSDFESEVGEDAVNTLWDKINAATNETLRKDYESGMLDKESYEGTKNMMKYYVPLRGWSEKTAEDVYDYYYTTAPIQRNQKKAGGRRSQADNPISYIAQMAQNAIVRGNRNKMKQRLFNFVVNRPTALATFQEGWYVKNNATKAFELEYPEIEEGDTAEDIQQKMDEFEKRMEELAKEKLAFKGKLPFGSPYRIKAKQKNEHVVPVMINGREYGIYINGNPRAAQAVNGMTNPEASNMMSEMYESVKRFYSAGLTSWNPDFLMANAVRDSIHSVTMTYLDKGPLAAAYYLRNIPSSLRTVAAEIFGKGTADPTMHQYFEEFVNYGGETGYTAIHTLEDYKKEYEKILKELSSLEKAVQDVKGGFSAMAKWMEQANRIFEDVNRFNAYQAARRSGLGIEESVDAAKNITVNFNKKGALGTTKGFWGSIAGVMSKWILFFNPTVQGITQIYRSRKMHPKRFNALLGAVFGSGLIVPFLNSMVVGMFGGDEEDYWLQNDYNRMNNLLLKNPFESGYFKIPLPPTFREIYGMGDILYRLMTDRITPERAAIATLRQLQLLTGFLNLIPDEEPDLGKALIGLAPDVLAPLTDVILNQDFTGRKIAKVSDYNKHDPEYLRVYKGVSPFYVEVSRYINEMGGDDISRAPLYGTFINPAYMEHVITGYSGGIGKTLSNVAGIVADAVSGEFYENFDLRKVPIVSRFYSVSDEATVKSAVNRKYRDYQSRYEKLKHDYKKYKAAVSEGELQFADELSQMDSSGEKEFVDYFGRKQKLLNKKLDRLKKNPDNKALEQEITDLKAEISLKCFELLK